MQHERNAGVLPKGESYHAEPEAPKVVRAKMRCTQVTKHDGGWETIKFNAQYDPNLPEDRRFSENTPNGSAEFSLTNKTLYGHYQPGKSYYFDIVEAD